MNLYLRKKGHHPYHINDLVKGLGIYCKIGHLITESRNHIQNAEVQLSAVAASCAVTLKRVGGEIRSSCSEIWKGEEECFG